MAGGGARERSLLLSVISFHGTGTGLVRDLG
jgi:hypothetical protein